MRQVRKAAERRAARSPKPAEDLTREVAEALPAIITPGDAAGGSTLDVIDHIRTCITTAMQVMQYARAEDGKVRNAKLLVAASEHLRRSLQTACKLRDAMVEVQRMDAFHKEILDAIESVHREFPAAAELIFRRTTALTQKWMNGQAH